MQRSIINKDYLKIFYLILLVIYDSIATVYILLPPLLGIIAIYFYQSLKDSTIYFTYALIIFLLILEANREFIFFSTSIFYIISYYYIIPHLKNITTCKKCLETIYIIIAYIGYIIFSIVLSYLLDTDFISIDIFLVIEYILIEIFIILVLL
jgi:hypothetical protein